MDKNLLEKLKQKLEKDKKEIEEQLKKIARKDEKLNDDWDTRYPRFNANSPDLEQAADEVEEYSNLLPVEHSLELRLKNINLALEKIKTKKYGTCEKCKEKIKEQRILAYPGAQFCLKCKN